jgi:aldose 1-epimerase
MGPGAHEIENGRGDRATVIGHGARLASLVIVTDARPVDVVLGHADRANYLDDQRSLGAVVGRVANRVSGAAFVLDGERHVLDANEPPNQLHGGSRGFATVPWHPDPDVPPSRESVTLRLVSPAGDQGYPGVLTVRANYRWGADRTLIVSYEATTDAPTIVNLSHHAYFNLGGGGDVRDHRLMVHAQQYTPTDGQMIPTGERRDVSGTALDFRQPRSIGEVLESEDPELVAKSGLDHNYVLSATTAHMPVAASVSCPRTALSMELGTDQPCMQIYTGNWLEEPFDRHGGVCLEPQGYPDAMGQPAFPDPVLRPGETYRWTMRLRFRSSVGGLP